MTMWRGEPLSSNKKLRIVFQSICTEKLNGDTCFMTDAIFPDDILFSNESLSVLMPQSENHYLLKVRTAGRYGLK